MAIQTPEKYHGNQTIGLVKMATPQMQKLD